MPSTCFVHSNLLFFVSGFMNYKAQRLLKEMESGKFSKPSGDVVITSFPRIYDNPDIVEELVTYWVNRAVPEITKANELGIDLIIKKMEDFVKKIYPVLFSEEFMMTEHTNTAKSGVGLFNSNNEPLD
jgi:hypothetical protein